MTMPFHLVWGRGEQLLPRRTSTFSHAPPVDRAHRGARRLRAQPPSRRRARRRAPPARLREGLVKRRVSRALAWLAFPLAVVPALAHADDPPCNAWEIEYALNGRLRRSDTAMGAGDGSHAIGPGKVVLRFENVAGQPGGRGEGHRIHDENNKFSVDARTLGIDTIVTTSSTRRRARRRTSAASPLEETWARIRQVRWSGPWTIHTDGQQNCSGSMCGKFGAPPSGQSPYHVAAPRAVQAVRADLRHEIVSHGRGRDEPLVARHRQLVARWARSTARVRRRRAVPLITRSSRRRSCGRP